MSKLLVVFGATGHQGGSVIDYVLNDSDLSKQYKIRGISRSKNSGASKSLDSKGVEIVEADVEKPETLKAALQGAHTVFSNTVTIYDERMYEREVSAGKAIADASVAAGAQYIIYSSSTPGGKFTGRPVLGFDSKFAVEEYIRNLPIKSAFYVPGSFYQNYYTHMKPRPTGDAGVYAISNTIHPDRKMPMLDIVKDTGTYIGAILADPDKYQGKNFYAASEMISSNEIAAAISKATGKTVRYNQYPEEVYKTFLPEHMQEPFCAMMAYLDKPGYYGPETDERVAWTMKQPRGKLITYEEYLRKNPLKLD